MLEEIVQYIEVILICPGWTRERWWPKLAALITKLTPTRFIASTMGIYFAMVGIGNKFAGSIGYYSQTLGESEIFISITFFCIILSLIVLIFIKKLNKLAHNADN